MRVEHLFGVLTVACLAGSQPQLADICGRLVLTSSGAGEFPGKSAQRIAGFDTRSVLAASTRSPPG